MHPSSDTSPSHATFLVFGDLHGRVLPAFRLATAWAKDHRRRVDGILQVGDLGYFPDPARLDKATLRHAKDDPLELGVLDVMRRCDVADATFDDPACPPQLWFTAGNHEDFDELERLSGTSGKQADFVVDYYCQVSCVKDGRVAELAGGLRVGAVWGVDDRNANHRTNLPDRGYIRPRAVDQLLKDPFDVLLCHDAPADAKRPGFGSELLSILVHLAQPRFVFFGHYKGEGMRCVKDFGGSEVHHMAGFELRTRDGTPEPGSVGVLTWGDGRGSFEHLDREWLKTFSRHNWKQR